MKIINKKFSFIVIMAFITLLSLQFNNCGQVDNPIKLPPITQQNNDNNGNNENLPYPPPRVPDDIPPPIDPEDPENPTPGKNACDDYNFIDESLYRLRKKNSDCHRSWRYGHYCPMGQNCIENKDDLSKVHIAYYKGRNPAERQGSSEIDVIEILNNCGNNPPQLDWNPQPNMQGTWIYLRDDSYPPPPPTCTSPPPTTSGTPTPGYTPLGQCSVPDRLSIVSKVAREHHSLLRNSNNCTKPGNYDFLEKVLVELRKTDTRWGYYHRTQHNLNHASKDAIAYYCGSGNGNRSSNLRFVDIISSSCRVQWDDTSHERHKDRANPANGYWKYPRTGGAVVPDSDFSDFDFSKVTWLHYDVSGWTESSHITSVQVKSGGQICTDYTEKGQWPAGEPLGNGTQLVGNPWVFVKISGRYYAATYEWLRPNQYCKFGHENTKPLSKVYNNAWGRHIKKSPLDRWIPKPGEIVGFMVSGLARNNVRNVRKRTNVQFYRLPAADGTGGATLGTYTDGRLSGDTGGGYSTCNSPSKKNKPARTMQHVVQKLATANDAAYKAVWDGSEYTEDYRFLDLVVNELHRIDERFGYNCVRGDCNRISADALAYYRGEGSPNNSADVIIIDFLRGAGRNTPTPAWIDVTDETCQKGSIGRWLYPRPGASPSSGGSGGGGSVPDGGGPDTAVSPDDSGSGDCSDSNGIDLSKVDNITCGRCANTHNLKCKAGTYSPHPGENNNFYRWTCRNIPFEYIPSCGCRQEDACHQIKSTNTVSENGKCDNSTESGCSSGLQNAAAEEDTDHYYQWRCDGINGGERSGVCRKKKNPPADSQPSNTRSARPRPGGGDGGGGASPNPPDSNIDGGEGDTGPEYGSV